MLFFQSFSLINTIFRLLVIYVLKLAGVPTYLFVNLI